MGIKWIEFEFVESGYRTNGNFQALVELVDGIECWIG